MTLGEEKAKVRQHLEAAVRLQRESWDQALAIEDVIRDDERDIYAFVAELAGGFKDDEAIPDEVIDMLMT